MASKPITWQARGQYLAQCCGLTPQQFAAGLDRAMGEKTQGTAARPAPGQRTGAGQSERRERQQKAATRGAGAKQPAGATN